MLLKVCFLKGTMSLTIEICICMCKHTTLIKPTFCMGFTMWCYSSEILKTLSFVGVTIIVQTTTTSQSYQIDTRTPENLHVWQVAFYQSIVRADSHKWRLPQRLSGECYDNVRFTRYPWHLRLNWIIQSTTTGMLHCFSCLLYVESVALIIIGSPRSAE